MPGYKLLLLYNDQLNLLVKNVAMLRSSNLRTPAHILDIENLKRSLLISSVTDTPAHILDIENLKRSLLTSSVTDKYADEAKPFKKIPMKQKLAPTAEPITPHSTFTHIDCYTDQESPQNCGCDQALRICSLKWPKITPQ